MSWHLWFCWHLLLYMGQLSVSSPTKAKLSLTRYQSGECLFYQTFSMQRYYCERLFGDLCRCPSHFQQVLCSTLNASSQNRTLYQRLLCSFWFLAVRHQVLREGLELCSCAIWMSKSPVLPVGGRICFSRIPCDQASRSIYFSYAWNWIFCQYRCHLTWREVNRWCRSGPVPKSIAEPIL